jgi:hypothetical protein
MPRIHSLNIFQNLALGFGSQLGTKPAPAKKGASKKRRNLDGLAVTGDQTKSEPSASAPGFSMKDIERLTRCQQHFSMPDIILSQKAL